MASIERTAYPRLRRHPTARTLNELYTPTPEEIIFARKSARSPQHQFTLLVFLKSFQRLGYFPKLKEVPQPIVNHIRSCLRLDQQTPIGYDGPRTLYRHHRGIRDFLQVKAYEKEARRLTIQAVYEAAQVMDNPADLINVALETLIKERYELPAFSTLDRLVRRVRTLVNRRFFQTICSRLQESDRAKLEALLVSDDHTRRSPFNRLKQLPKKPTLSHLQEWLDHLEWLISWGEVGGSLAGLAHLKIKHFAAEAKALDAGEIKDFLPTKRHALLVCLIHRMSIHGFSRDTCKIGHELSGFGESNS